jgi:ribose transport system permease protein
MTQDPTDTQATAAPLRSDGSDSPARPETPKSGRRNSRLPGFIQSSAGILAATILLFLASGLLQPQSLGSSALSGMLPFAAILAIVSLGQTLVIQQGGIDLSVPGVVSLSAVIVSYYAVNHQGPDGPALGTAILCAYAAALAAGVINGLLVSVAGVAPIVATIGMNALLYGVNLKISGGTPVSTPEAMTRFANAKIFGVTVLAGLAVLIAAALIFLIKKTVFGRRFEAAGASPRAARAAGLTSGRYQIAAYAGAALLYCTGGVLLGGIMQLPSAFQGDTYLMPSIAAVVLGGTSLFGGSGNLAATVIAALFLTQLQQLVLTTGASIGVQYLFQGAAIIVGVGVYSINLRELKTQVLTLLGVSRRETINTTSRRSGRTFQTH